MSNRALYDQQAIQLRVAEGDEDAFALLFNHYYPLLRPLVAGYALSNADMEEILQETFIRVWLYRDRLPGIENFHGWICRVASRECLTMLRKNLRNRKHLAALEPDNTMPSTADKTHLSEISRLIREAVDQMPARRRRIYQMSRVEGMKPAEIAEALSISLNTVRNVLVKALNRSGNTWLLRATICPCC